MHAIATVLLRTTKRIHHRSRVGVAHNAITYSEHVRRHPAHELYIPNARIHEQQDRRAAAPTGYRHQHPRPCQSNTRRKTSPYPEPACCAVFSIFFTCPLLVAALRLQHVKAGDQPVTLSYPKGAVQPLLASKTPISCDSHACFLPLGPGFT